MSRTALKVGQAVVSVPVSCPIRVKKMQRVNEVVAVKGFNVSPYAYTQFTQPPHFLVSTNNK
jgi:hypothetical protein